MSLSIKLPMLPRTVAGTITYIIHRLSYEGWNLLMAAEGYLRIPHRRGIRFVLHGVSDRSLSLSHSFFLSLKDGACHFFQNTVTPEIMVGIAPYLGHRGTLGAPSIFDF